MSTTDGDGDQSRRRQRLAGLGAFGAIFAISIASVFGGELIQSSSAERNRAPDLDLMDVDTGEPRRLDEENPTVIRFVDATCSSCDVDLAELEHSRRRWMGKINYVVVAATADDKTVREALGSVDSSILVSGDPTSSTAAAYRVADVPATIFVTANGQVNERRPGALQREDLERRIRALIAAGPAR